jgi:hypothetical protein
MGIKNHCLTQTIFNLHKENTMMDMIKSKILTIVDMNTKVLTIVAMVLLMTSSCYSVPSTGEKPGFYSEIYNNGRVINFSDEAVVGKINIFILNIQGCTIGTSLKQKLLDAGFDPDYVQLIYVLTEGTQKWQEFKASRTYETYMAIENLREWPQVVIVNPAGNVTKRFDATTLSAQGNKNTVFDETVRLVNNLYDNMKTLEQRADFITPCSKDSFWKECRTLNKQVLTEKETKTPVTTAPPKPETKQDSEEPWWKFW